VRARAALPRGTGGRFGTFHLRPSRSWAIAPPRAVLLHEVRVRQDEVPVQRRDCRVDVFLRGFGRLGSAGPVSGPSAAIAATSPPRSLRLVWLTRRDQGRDEPWPRRRSRHARRASRRRPGPGAGRSSLAPRRSPSPSSHSTKPPSARATAQFRPASPLTCSQSEGRTTSVFGNSSATPTLSTPSPPATTCAPPLSSLPECDRLPLRALRYDPQVAGPLDELVAAAVRRDLRRAAPRLSRAARTTSCTWTLPTPTSRRRRLAAWQEQGVLAREITSIWWIAQDYKPAPRGDGTREGVPRPVRCPVSAVRGASSAGARADTRWAEGGPLAPVCARRRRSSSRSSCSTTPSRLHPPEGRAGGRRRGWEGMRTRMWPIAAGEVRIERRLLIADGHHRYETAVAYREENPAATTLSRSSSVRAPGSRSSRRTASCSPSATCRATRSTRPAKG